MRWISGIGDGDSFPPGSFAEVSDARVDKAVFVLSFLVAGICVYYVIML